MNTRILVIISAFVNYWSYSRIIETNFYQYCSSDFIFDGLMRRICTWVDEKSKIFDKMSEHQLSDCPLGYYFDDFNQLLNNKVLLKMDASSCGNAYESYFNNK
jgi:hypothetical protein